jgi:hypothetical protein
MSFQHRRQTSGSHAFGEWIGQDAANQSMPPAVHVDTLAFHLNRPISRRDGSVPSTWKSTDIAQWRWRRPTARPKTTQEQLETTMRWEYLVLERTLGPDDFSRLGSEGWELVAVVSPGHFVLHYFFKRQAHN